MTKVYRLCTRSLLISKTARRYDKDTILTLVDIRTCSGKHHPKCRSLALLSKTNFQNVFFDSYKSFFIIFMNLPV